VASPSPEFAVRQGLALHVAFEIRQMVGAALLIDSTDDVVTDNALLESTLLHARALIEFLLNIGHRPTDVTASTFLPGWEIEAEHRESLDAPRKLLNKHLAHLTTDRVTDRRQAWPYPEIVNELIDHLRRYHAQLPHESQARYSIGGELERVDAALGRDQDAETALSSTTPPPIFTVNQGHNRLTLSDFVD
jgi:hypothetical protein